MATTANSKDEFVPLKDGGDTKWPVPDIQLRKSQTIVDNVLLKRMGVKVQLTPEQELELMKCSLDPIYFIETYARIMTLDHGVVAFKLYKYQKKMIRNYVKHRFNVACTARQMGKTTVVAAFLLWMLIFNKNKNWAVLANKADQALEIMDRFRMMYEELPYFIQQGVKTFNLAEVELENKSGVFSGSSNPDTVRGKSLNGVYWDEAAFTARDEEFWNSTFPVLSSGDTTKIILTSTPKGARGVFYKIWKESEDPTSPKWNGFVRIAVPWNEHPKRDEAWKAATIAKTSPSQFEQEHNLAFLGSSGTLIPMAVLQAMQWNNPLNADEHFQIYDFPQEDHKYVAVADCSEGVGQDYSVCTIFDVTQIPYRVVAKYRNNEIGPLLFPYQLVSICERYNQCPLLIESNNDVGGQVSYITYYDLEYPEVVLTTPDTKGMSMKVGGATAKPGVKTTSKVKMIGCANLKTLLENGKLVIEDQHMIEELGVFIAKGNTYQADEGCHDDTVMTLVLFSWLMKQDWFVEHTETNIQNSLHDGNIQRLRDELMPFFTSNGVEETAQHSISQYGYVDGLSTGISFQQWMNS